MKQLIVLSAISLFLAGCVLFEDEDKRTYFKQEATGYVYNEKTKEPAPNVRVTVSSNFRSYEWATKPAVDEYFYTDSTGFFRIRFLKRTDRQNVEGINVDAYDDINRLNSKLYSCTVDELNELILTIDTLWIR